MKKRVRDLDDGVSVDLERKEENKKGIQGEETGKHLNAKPNSKFIVTSTFRSHNKYL